MDPFLLLLLLGVPLVWSGDLLDNFDVSTPELDSRAELNNYHINDSFDHHKYYTSVFRHTDDFWVDFLKLNETQPGIVKENPLLKNSYRQAATIGLTFPFPFYGYTVSNITIATGGFLYTGDHVHSWLAATHYIAPLMANFDLRDGTGSILYADNGSALTVEWRDVHLNESNESPFSFQVTLHHTGDIIFAYKEISLGIEDIDDSSHPVKVGLSDAYTIDKSVLYVRRKTIYEYHRINLRNSSIVNSSAIIFTSLPTCNIQRTCASCIAFNSVNKATNGVDFKCHWCPSLVRCSDGMDRYLQKWLSSDCHTFNISTSEGCDSIDSKYTPYKPQGNSEVLHFDNSMLGSSAEEGKRTEDKMHRLVHVDLVILVLLGIIVLLVVFWFAYAYIYPHTWSGQLLIKYRPNQWQWGRNEPRYTAASIHM